MTAAAMVDAALASAGGATAEVRRADVRGKKSDDHAVDQAPAVRLIRGDAVPLEPVHWLWPGFLPAGNVTILGGAPGCGKTTIALSIAATVTRGGRWPDGTRCAEPGDVIVWSGEDGHAVIASRLVAAGADMTRVYLIDGMTGADGEPFDPAHDVALLESTAAKLAAPRLLILDPIVSAVAGDGHKSNDVRRSLQPVVSLAQRLGCAALCITHFSKGTMGRDPVERIIGSIAFVALARVVLVAAKVKADEGGEPRRVLMRAKSNNGPDDGGFAYALDRVQVAADVEGQRVEWLEALEGTARELLADAEADSEVGEESSALADAIGFLESELRDGPKPAKAIFREARDAGHSERTIKRAKSELKVESIKERSAWVWALPIKRANSAKGANDSKAPFPGPHADEPNNASALPLGNLGTVGTLGPLADTGEVI